MTTHHSYSEHSDVDASVVEDSHASETATPTPSSTVAASTGEHAPVESTPPDTQLAGGHVPQTLSVTEAQEGSTPAPEPLALHETPDNVDATTEVEVKPFTAFIEEFRQTEARFNKATQEAQEAQGTQTETAITNPSSSSPSFTPFAPISSVEGTFVPEFTMPWETPQIAATPTNESAE